MSEMVAKVALAILDAQEHRRRFGNQGVTEPIALARAALVATRDFLKNEVRDTGSVIHTINGALNAEE